MLSALKNTSYGNKLSRYRRIPNVILEHSQSLIAMPDEVKTKTVSSSTVSGKKVLVTWDFDLLTYFYLICVGLCQQSVKFYVHRFQTTEQTRPCHQIDRESDVGREPTLRKGGSRFAAPMSLARHPKVPTMPTPSQTPEPP